MGQEVVAEVGRPPHVGPHVAAGGRGVGDQQPGLQLLEREQHHRGDDHGVDDDRHDAIDGTGRGRLDGLEGLQLTRVEIVVVVRRCGQSQATAVVAVVVVIAVVDGSVHDRSILAESAPFSALGGASV